MRWALLSFVLLASPAWSLDQLKIGEFGGINTDDAAVTLEKGQSPDSANILTDDGPGIKPRGGYISVSTTAATAMWTLPHTNGTRYRIIHSTNNRLVADDGDGTFNIMVSTVASGVATSGTVLGNTFYFANTVDGYKGATFSGTTASIAFTSATLTFNQIVTHKSRVWGIGKASSERTIFASEFNDGTDFTLAVDPVATDPAQFVIGGALDQSLTALYASHQDGLVWMKPNSFGKVIGNSRTDFAIRTYSDQVGTAYVDSIQDCSGYLRWMGASRTIWEFDGAKHYPISKRNPFSNSAISTLLDDVVQGDANARSFSWTSQSDFNAGTNNFTSNSITAGSVLLSTWTDQDTTQADFGAGTLTNVSTLTVSGDLYLSTDNANHINNDFETCSSGDATGWEEVSSNSECSSLLVSPQSGTYYMNVGSSLSDNITLTVKLLDPSNTVIATMDSYTSGATAESWVQKTIDTSPYAGMSVKLQFITSGGSFNGNVRTSSPFILSGTDITFYIYKLNNAGTIAMLVDLVENGRSSIASGSFTSASMDTGFKTPMWLASSPTVTTNGHTVTFQTQVSADDVSYDSAVTWTTGTAPTSANKRYIKYLIAIATTSSGTALPYISAVPLSARQSTGTWVSQSVSMSGATSWGVTEISGSESGGSLAYTLYTDTDSTKTIANGIPVFGTWISSQTITSPQIPTIATNTYTFVSTTFTITSATQTPTVTAASVRWTEGSTLRVASLYPSQRYWLSVAINSTTNNRILVYDRDREWQLYTGIEAAALATYSGSTLFSNTSGVWQAEVGTTDNGSPISAYYKTATFAPGGLDLVSIFHDLIINTDNSSDTLETTYQIDGVDDDYSLADYDMAEQEGFQNVKLPFPFSQIQQGKMISLKWSVTGSSTWRFLGATLYYQKDRIPQ